MLVYGQELNEQTYAICKADMLIKGQEATNIRHGNTLSGDMFPGDKFDYIMMNPPFGREWKSEKNAVEAEAKKGAEGRFPAGTPGISDSQTLFLQNAISKMKPEGSKIAIIHNGSALFKGDAGSGESEIRRFVLENDLLDCIIQLPNDIFYNTGIYTYIWILSNKKPLHRQGKVQLINAASYFTKMRKALGNKKNEMRPKQIEQITKLYGDFIETKDSKIFNINEFGYRKVAVVFPKLDENNEPIFNQKNEFVIDKEKNDYETIPLTQTIEEYIDNNVKPYVKYYDIDNSKTKIGYEIAFSKYFYEYKEPRKSADILNEIYILDKEADLLLKEIENNG